MAEKSSNFNGMILYQIYPRSFCDTNGDGVGDLPGITSKLDYLKTELGINTIWISPFFKSPMADFGYDISDHCEIDPLFGDMRDFDEMLHQAHRRGLRVMIDFVANHTSEQHRWFKEALSSKNNPKRDWYIWRDPNKDGSPPNNWLSVFGGSAWTLDESSNQYYLHSFLRQQPDLNWDNPEVRKAQQDVIKFWLDKGVDGIRVDSVPSLSKDPLFRDNPPSTSRNSLNHENYESPLLPVYSMNGPELFKYLDEIADVVKSYPARHMVLEAYPAVQETAKEYYASYYAHVDPAISAPFYMGLIGVPWRANVFEKKINNFESIMRAGYSPVYCFGNHDRSRLASRIGAENTGMAAMLALTLPGVPVIYNGDELGMVNGRIAREDLRDPFALHVRGFSGRDPERTPMAWDDSPNGGFTEGMPWLPMNKDYEHWNVAAQLGSGSSLLELYRHLIALRTQSVTLSEGDYELVRYPVPDIFAYDRHNGNERVRVALNFSDQRREIKDDQLSGGELLLSTLGAFDISGGVVVLRPHEGIAVRLQSAS